MVEYGSTCQELQSKCRILPSWSAYNLSFLFCSLLWHYWNLNPCHFPTKSFSMHKNILSSYNCINTCNCTFYWEYKCFFFPPSELSKLLMLKSWSWKMQVQSCYQQKVKKVLNFTIDVILMMPVFFIMVQKTYFIEFYLFVFGKAKLIIHLICDMTS